MAHMSSMSNIEITLAAVRKLNRPLSRDLLENQQANAVATRPNSGAGWRDAVADCD